MRTGVVQHIHDYMRKDHNSYFLVGDLGYHVVEDVEKEFPERFINVGVAEQNMIGIAAGLALAGNKVFVYSIIPFVTMRCYEQIRDDLCYHDLDVVLIGAGAGLSYGILSATHFALEDVAILRVLPNMVVFSPADETEAVLGMKAITKQKHPTYVRIGKRTEPTIYEKPYKFKLGKVKVLQDGQDITIFASGPIIDEVIQTVRLLEKKMSISICLVNIHTIKPLDEKTILLKANGKKIIFTVEEHGKIGGLGSAVSEVLAEKGLKTKVIRIGTVDEFVKKIGSQPYLRKALHLDAQGIFMQMKKYL